MFVPVNERQLATWAMLGCRAGTPYLLGCSWVINWHEAGSHASSTGPQQGKATVQLAGAARVNHHPGAALPHL